MVFELLSKEEKEKDRKAVFYTGVNTVDKGRSVNFSYLHYGMELEIS